jgi:hypothetical protein
MTINAPTSFEDPDPQLVTGERCQKVDNESEMAWRSLRPGNVVSLEDATARQHVVGSVDARTDDGLIIWIRDGLNDRKAYHFDDCLSVRLLG